jgi:hypothetical protein
MASLVNEEGHSALSISLLSGAEIGVTRKALKQAWRQLLDGEYIAVKKEKGWPRYSFNLQRIEMSFFDGYPTVTIWCGNDPLR